MSRIQRPLGSRSPPKGFSDSYSSRLRGKGVVHDLISGNDDDNLPVLEPQSWSNEQQSLEDIPRINLHLVDVKKSQFKKQIPSISINSDQDDFEEKALNSPSKKYSYVQSQSRTSQSFKQPQPPHQQPPPPQPIKELSQNVTRKDFKLPSHKFNFSNHSQEHLHNSSSPELFRDSRASSLYQTQSKTNSCFVCKSNLSSTQEVVRTDYGSIHLACFSCSKCKTSLIHSEFYYSADTEKLYCHLDYHQKFSPRCGLCKTPIENKGIFALGKHWHDDHFFCHECSNPISSTEPFFVLNDNTMCEKCHIKKTSIKCWKCQHPCTKDEEVIETLGRQWCTKCFSCEECNEPFPGYEFILRSDGTLVCQECEYLKLKKDTWK